MVFDVYEKVSYAILLTANRPLQTFDVAKNP